MTQAITDLTNAVNAAVAELQAAQVANAEDTQVEALAMQLQAAVTPVHAAVATVVP